MIGTAALVADADADAVVPGAEVDIYGDARP